MSSISAQILFNLTLSLKKAKFPLDYILKNNNRTMEVNRQIKSFQLKKAYMISLCLSAQRVLAESTGEDAAVEEKASGPVY